MRAIFGGKKDLLIICGAYCKKGGIRLEVDKLF